MQSLMFCDPACMPDSMCSCFTPKRPPWQSDDQKCFGYPMLRLPPWSEDLVIMLSSRRNPLGPALLILPELSLLGMPTTNFSSQSTVHHDGYYLDRWYDPDARLAANADRWKLLARQMAILYTKSPRLATSRRYDVCGWGCESGPHATRLRATPHATRLRATSRAMRYQTTRR